MSTSKRPKPTALQRIAIFFIAHVLISAALIAAVGSLLFYLIDIRATILTGSNDLRRIGGWFVVATVLIVRLRHTYPHPARAVLYTAALFLASLWALTQFRSFGLDLNGNPCRDSTTLVNALVLGFTWWFATRFGRLMSIDDDMYDALIRMDSACDELVWSGDSETKAVETIDPGQRAWVASLRRRSGTPSGEYSGFFPSLIKRIALNESGNFLLYFNAFCIGFYQAKLDKLEHFMFLTAKTIILNSHHKMNKAILFQRFYF